MIQDTAWNGGGWFLGLVGLAVHVDNQDLCSIPGSASEKQGSSASAVWSNGFTSVDPVCVYLLDFSMCPLSHLKRSQ